MREILFRGKRIDNGEWVEGFYIEDRWGDSDGKEIYGILQDRTHPPSISDWIPIRIKKETVGQYTGLTDKNGKKIFEGDVLRVANSNIQTMIIEVHFGEYEYEDERHIGIYIKVKRHGDFEIAPVLIENLLESCEIIGNIHDNPELLEENK